MPTRRSSMISATSSWRRGRSATPPSTRPSIASASAAWSISSASWATTTWSRWRSTPTATRCPRASSPSFSRSSDAHRAIEHARGMERFPRRAMRDLVAAARAGGDEDRVGRGLAHLGQHAEFADLHRDFVMLGLVAEGSCHAAAGALEALDLEPGHEAKRGDARADEVERLLMAMAVQHGLAGERLELGREAAGCRLGGDEFLEEQRVLGERLCLGAGQHGRQLVAQRQEARGLKAHDRHAARDKRLERGEEARGLALCLIDEARRQEGATAAERAFARRRR